MISVKGRVAPIRTIPTFTYNSVRKAVSNQTGILIRFPKISPKANATKGASKLYWLAHFQALKILMIKLKINNKIKPEMKWLTLTFRKETTIENNTKSKTKSRIRDVRL